MTPRSAALTLLGLAAVGHLVIRWRGGNDRAPGELLAVPREAVSPARQRDSALAAARPLGPDERVDLDRASAREIERLPGIGPAVAARIVAWRTAHGAFGGLARLDSVPGVGPAMLARLAPHAAFSGVPAGGDSTADEVVIHLQPGEVRLDRPEPPVEPRPKRSRRR